ncbi:tRNA pseudouridine(55) synthase TruB [Actinomyces sp. B33]|uniref:tRNA pseudouridine(55) synthase TruB n=1 Tax=Actinomyces sp. B33 TaxID=2942131 RepID=UPI0023427D3E|nr:tRNA pseudouridine(55) synthase TruB [Actinomyces sp. B33]MDC4233022.1 tRNA pseudouridine(55) synthase TruB [Actinomyces sp. B33]
MARRSDTPVPGLVVVDKPQGMTSHDVVSRVRRLAGTRKVGHAGTLDPMATGVLVLGIGKATKLLTWVTGHAKTYEATIRLGVSTDTDDAEGRILDAPGAVDAAPDRLAEAMRALTGDIMQVPSSVSAIKVNGERAYALARRGVDVELAARPVSVARFDLLAPPRPGLAPSPDGRDVPIVDADVVVDCSSGTYIRALARDLGRGLGCGAHLIALRRTRVGDFGLDDALTLDALESAALPAPEDPGAVPVSRIPLIPLDEAVLDMFAPLALTADEARAFAHGQAPRRAPADLDAQIDGLPERILAAVDPDGRVLGLLRCTPTRVRTELVFHTEN